METQYLHKFCELLNNTLPLTDFTGTTFLKEIQRVSQKNLKSEIDTNLVTQSDAEAKKYLHWVVTRIRDQDYFKYTTIKDIQTFLDQFSVDINDLLDYDIEAVGHEFYTLLEAPLEFFNAELSKKQLAIRMRSEFINYFCKIYADEIINYAKAKPQFLYMEKVREHKVNYLNAFCDSVSSSRDLKDTSLIGLYEYSITHYTPYLETEILENLLQLDNSKKEDYLNYAKDLVNKTPFIEVDEATVDEILKHYQSSIEDFPNNLSPELYKELNTYYRAYHLSPSEQFKIESLQNKFYAFLAGKEARRMLEFIESKKEISEQGSKESTKSNQLTANQIVILLDKLSLFTDPNIEDISQVKQADLLSKITGLDKDNFRSHIRKLDKYKGSNIPSSYRADIDKIEQILDSLK